MVVPECYVAFREVFTMLNRHLIVVLMTAGLLVPLCASAQQRRRKPPQMPTESFAATGTIEAIGQGVFRVLTTSDQQWMIWVDQKTKIHVTGTAEADFVRPGMFIKFKADVDKNGNALAKGGNLTLFTPSLENPVGIWPEGAGSDDAEENNPGADVEPDADATKSLGVFTIAGQITDERRGKMTVNAMRGVVTIELAEKPKIDIALADGSLARPGDKVTIKGKRPVGRMGVAQATELNIVLAQPLAMPGKKKPPRKPAPPRRRPVKKNEPKAEEDAPDAER